MFPNIIASTSYFFFKVTRVFILTDPLTHISCSGIIVALLPVGTITSKSLFFSVPLNGYHVSTVGLDEAKIREYIKDQEENESIEDKYDTDLSNPLGSCR